MIHNHCLSLTLHGSHLLEHNGDILTISNHWYWKLTHRFRNGYITTCFLCAGISRDLRKSSTQTLSGNRSFNMVSVCKLDRVWSSNELPNAVPEPRSIVILLWERDKRSILDGKVVGFNKPVVECAVLAPSVSVFLILLRFFHL